MISLQRIKEEYGLYFDNSHRQKFVYIQEFDSVYILCDKYIFIKGSKNLTKSFLSKKKKKRIIKL